MNFQVFAKADYECDVDGVEFDVSYVDMGTYKADSKIQAISQCRKNLRDDYEAFDEPQFNGEFQAFQLA